jgi:hypothetical protein
VQLCDLVLGAQARFTKSILEKMAGIDFPMDRIFSMTVSGKPKSGVLAMLQERHTGFQCNFVEDKLSTLQKVETLPELSAYHLFFVDWGYNTEAERQYARDSDRMELISSSRFGDLLTAGQLLSKP